MVASPAQRVLVHWPREWSRDFVLGPHLAFSASEPGATWPGLTTQDAPRTRIDARAAIYADCPTENGFLYVAERSIEAFHRRARVLLAV